ncbi:MAG: alpha/beta hydrolase, partial [Halieaceae bacterium]|nr:alpha/beta hydrolase [Halieaceae bacterium]
VLVGFSYGGFVVTAALEHLSSRIAHLVYLDAFVPDAGETPMAHVFGMGRMPVELEGAWTLPPVQREYDDPAEGEWMSQRRTPHPTGCFAEPVYLEQPLEDYSFTRTYIKATKTPESDMGAAALWRAADRAKKSPAWTYREIATTHMVANNKPGELVDLLKEVISP